jgi:hypothetical protein
VVKNNKITFLAFCANLISHVYNCAINNCVETLLKAENCKYKILTENNVDFYNIMFSSLFICNCVNETLHIIQ